MFNKLSISDRNSCVIKNCSLCNKPFTEELWCKECDPQRKVKGWSGNPVIDKFIKDTMYENYHECFEGWIPFCRFTDIKEVGEGGFAKVYSAIWLGHEYRNRVALKRLNGSQNISDKYLNEFKLHCNFFLGPYTSSCLVPLGITKDPETQEFMTVMDFASKGNLRNYLSIGFNRFLWNQKLYWLCRLIKNLKSLHKLGYLHKDFHSGNILLDYGPADDHEFTYVSDFGLSGPANEQKPDDKVYGVMPYIAPELLNGEAYTSSSDIYSFGVVMAELSSGKPPFYKKKHDYSLSLAVCNGLRPEFGKGAPEIYKKLAYKCMDANPNERPTSDELVEIILFWYHSTKRLSTEKCEELSYERKGVRAAFEESDKEIPNILTSYESNPDAVYTSRAFTFKNLLPKPINSTIITAYVNDEESTGDFDSQLINLDVSNYN